MQAVPDAPLRSAEVAAQRRADFGLAQLAQGLGLDLPHPLARQAERLERVHLPAAEPVAHRQHQPLALVRAIARGHDPSVHAVRAAMTSDVACRFVDQDVRNAGRRMEERQIRRLAVTNRSGEPEGIVTLGDLALHTPGARLTGEILLHVAEPAHTAS